MVTREELLHQQWDALRGWIEHAGVLDDAVALVRDVLSAAYVEQVGHAPGVGEPMDWIRRATGRVPSDDVALPLL